MKVLTLTQPWATAIALGHKKLETRSWTTAYRGPLAIHAAKGFPAWAREFAEEEKAIGRIPHRIPLSAIVCVATLVNVQPTEYVAPEPLEAIYGDYGPGRFAWFLEDIRPLREPIAAKGALGLWTPDPEVLQAITRGLL